MLEFSSITFIIASLLMAYAHFVRREQTGTHPVIAVATVALLAIGLFAILGYPWLFSIEAPWVNIGLYAALGIGSAIYSWRRESAD